MTNVDEKLSQAFVCPKGHHQGAKVEHLALSGAGFSRLLDIQAHRYAVAACATCEYTEIYDLADLERFPD